VVDLSSLWAGPLCGHLLHLLGARVIKVESGSRADGARFGEPAFFDLMNAGKESVALDLATGQGRGQLRGLIEHADIVIEASRPRALRQLGLAAEEIVARRPSLTWIALSGYGRREPQDGWIAYGDDAGVAAGLTTLLHESTGELLICGDAIADPLAGLHAALAAWASHVTGGGKLIAVALSAVVAHAASFELPACTEGRRSRFQRWDALLRAEGVSAAPPRARPPAGAASAMGAHTAAVLSEFGLG
jgi:crotonobetainyl-CoA:carnitine CoA-transferase CaiB-like acyl-CoA transferase